MTRTTAEHVDAVAAGATRTVGCCNLMRSWRRADMVAGSWRKTDTPVAAEETTTSTQLRCSCSASDLAGRTRRTTTATRAATVTATVHAQSRSLPTDLTGRTWATTTNAVLAATTRNPCAAAGWRWFATAAAPAAGSGTLTACCAERSSRAAELAASWPCLATAAPDDGSGTSTACCVERRSRAAAVADGCRRTS
jgi:hypothetical protein